MFVKLNNNICLNMHTYVWTCIHMAYICHSLKLRLHTAIKRADFVSGWMWFNDSPTKVQRHFLTNASLVTFVRM